MTNERYKKIKSDLFNITINDFSDINEVLKEIGLSERDYRFVNKVLEYDIDIHLKNIQKILEKEIDNSISEEFVQESRDLRKIYDKVDCELEDLISRVYIGKNDIYRYKDFLKNPILDITNTLISLVIYERNKNYLLRNFNKR